MVRRGRMDYRQWTDVPKAMLDLAKERTAFLLTPHVIGERAMSLTLANAYLQGMQDAADTAAAVMHREFIPKQPDNAPEGVVIEARWSEE